MGQESYLYNSEGQLLVDTSLSINNNQLKAWQIIERDVVGVIAAYVDYSHMAREAGINGTLIAAFDYNSNGLKDIRIVRRLGGGLDESVLNGLEKTKSRIDREFKIIFVRADMKGKNIEGTYFIPFDFGLIDVIEKLKEKHAIPVIQSKLLLLD